MHFASFPLFMAATVHAFAAGTDAWSRAFEIAAAAVSVVVVGLTAWRIHQARPQATGGSRPAPVAPPVASGRTFEPV